jgi:L-amino acid N-acyltransferase YncA
MEIRTAHASDLPQIAAIVRPIVAAGETYAYPDELGDDDISRLWFEPPPGHTIVAVADGNVVGKAKMGPSRPGRGDHIGTVSFMVDPESSVRGVGRAMGAWVIDWHRRNGYAAIQSMPKSRRISAPSGSGSPWGSRSSARCRGHFARAPMVASGFTSCI